jgi:hypothetical protein
LSEKAALKAAGRRTAMTEMTSKDELSWAACTKPERAQAEQDRILKMSRGTAVILLVIYLAYR